MNAQMIEDFKTYLVQSMNEDVYYQLKDWLAQNCEDDDAYESTMDYMLENINGSLQWVD